MMKYHDQLKHPLWQKKRLEVLESRGYLCEECGADNETLHVHHPFYKRGAMIWDYEKHELQCLCEKCHKDAHALDERIRLSLSRLYKEDKIIALGYIDALLREEPHGDDLYMRGYVDYFRTETEMYAHLIKQEWGVK